MAKGIVSPLLGVVYVVRGMGLVFHSGLRRFVVLPILINSLLFGAGIWWGYGWILEFQQLIEDWLPSWLTWLSYLLIPLFIVGVVLAIFFGFALLMNMIGSSFNAMLAEKVEWLLTGQRLPPGGEWGKILRGILPGIWDEMGKIFSLLGWMLLLSIVFIIPVVNILAPFLWLLFAAWSLATEYLDYPMNNHNLNRETMRGLLKKDRLVVFSFGLSVLVLTMIPVINFFSMPAAVAGATLFWVERLQPQHEI
ncbi:MAG: sulfate transporter CysZ [Magnetococcus sp. DMHC-6]